MFTKQVEGQNSVIMKFEVSNLEIPLFNLLALIYEIELYTNWFPFCKQSRELIHISKARKIASCEFMLPVPFSNRGSVLYGCGVNRTKIDGSIVVVAKSLNLIPERTTLGVLNNPKYQKLLKPNLVNMICQYYCCEILPVEKDRINMRAVFCVDP
mmetsp:Transcript_11637/g.8494  ORF Transcript_11637/g.8494 Transcript_11637/m.8494 type:complete len:155 (+) Transcript_11637:217-681(+)